MKRFVRVTVKRFFQSLVQVFGIVTVVFFLIRLIPGNPAITLAGVGARPESIRAIEVQLGLDKPIVVQYAIYLGNLMHGDLGRSFVTGQPVTADLLRRFPATLEMIIVSMAIQLIVGLCLGVSIAMRPKGLVSGVVFLYGMLSGAFPNFWLALILVFVFFYLLRWAPPPMGRLGLNSPPAHVTGFYLVDSLIQGDLKTFWLAAKYLALPVLTLVLVYMGNIIKITRTSLDEIMRSEFMEYARALGLPRSTILRYALRPTMASVFTVVAFNLGFLLGGAVLVEAIFSWGGLGEYALQSLTHSDYAPLQGFVLLAALYMAVIYFLLDVALMLLDPRIEA